MTGWFEPHLHVRTFHKRPSILSLHHLCTDTHTHTNASHTLDVNKHLQYLSSSRQKSILQPQQNLMSRLIQVRREQSQTSGKIEESIPLENGMKAKIMHNLPQLGVIQKMGISFVNLLFNIPPVRGAWTIWLVTDDADRCWAHTCTLTFSFWYTHTLLHTKTRAQNYLASLARVARLVLADNAWRFGVDWKGTTAKWKSRFHELEEHMHFINTHPSYPTYYLKVCVCAHMFMSVIVWVSETETDRKTKRQGDRETGSQRDRNRRMNCFFSHVWIEFVFQRKGSAPSWFPLVMLALTMPSDLYCN